MGFSEKQREILRFPYRDYDARRGAVGKNLSHVVVLLPVGNGTFQRLRVCTLWEVGRSGGAQHCDAASGGAVFAAELHHFLQPLRPCNYGPAWGAGEPLLPVRRQGRELLHADSGYHPGGGFAGRGGPDAPLFCGTGHGSVLRDRGKAMVQLQPGGAAALVPAGVDSKGGGAQGPPSALHHGGQPGAGRGHPGQIPEHVCRGVLPAVHSGPVGHVGGAYLRHV